MSVFHFWQTCCVMVHLASPREGRWRSLVLEDVAGVHRAQERRGPSVSTSVSWHRGPAQASTRGPTQQQMAGLQYGGGVLSTAAGQSPRLSYGC
jgi:hypothetical protein